MKPRVTIGLPVFNGQSYLVPAVGSILGQTFGDFELIICDNASTDGTEAICRAFAARDGRIRYVRHERNLGAGRNFNRAFALASGEYFKWAAHDDVLAPEFLAKCVAALDGNPDAVLCQSEVQVIDAAGNLIRKRAVQSVGADAVEPSRRFAALILARHPATEIFGLIRREALKDSVLHADYYGSDRALLAQLALRGRFIRLPEPLFMHRVHPNCYRSMDFSPVQWLTWYNPDMAGRNVWHHWALYAAYYRMVGKNVTDRSERVRCYGHLARWPVTRWNFFLLTVSDPIGAIDPRVPGALRSVKRRVLGPDGFFLRWHRARVKP